MDGKVDPGVLFVAAHTTRSRGWTIARGFSRSQKEERRSHRRSDGMETGAVSWAFWSRVRNRTNEEPGPCHRQGAGLPSLTCRLTIPAKPQSSRTRSQVAAALIRQAQRPHRPRSPRPLRLRWNQPAQSSVLAGPELVERQPSPAPWEAPRSMTASNQPASAPASYTIADASSVILLVHPNLARAVLQNRPGFGLTTKIWFFRILCGYRTSRTSLAPALQRERMR